MSDWPTWLYILVAGGFYFLCGATGSYLGFLAGRRRNERIEAARTERYKLEVLAMVEQFERTREQKGD